MTDDMADPTKTTQSKHSGLIPFKPGQSGNPAGRPKGSRNKLGEAFLADMLADWEVHGIETIVKVREEKPEQYLKVVAGVLPKELNLRVNDFDELTDEQLARQLASIAAQLANAGISLDARVEAPEVPEQAGGIQTIQ